MQPPPRSLPRQLTHSTLFSFSKHPISLSCSFRNSSHFLNRILSIVAAPLPLFLPCRKENGVILTIFSGFITLAFSSFHKVWDPPWGSWKLKKNFTECYTMFACRALFSLPFVGNSGRREQISSSPPLSLYLLSCFFSGRYRRGCGLSPSSLLAMQYSLWGRYTYSTASLSLSLSQPPRKVCQILQLM